MERNKVRIVHDPTECPHCREQEAQRARERRMWLAIRRGLVAVARAIEERYPERDDRRAA